MTNCPVWPCEILIALISAGVGAIFGFYVGRRGRTRT